MTDFDHKAALRPGRWDPRYAVMLASNARDGVAAALVDTNGDGADVDLDQYEQAADGQWVEVSSGNCGESGAFSTGSWRLLGATRTQEPLSESSTRQRRTPLKPRTSGGGCS